MPPKKTKASEETSKKKLGESDNGKKKAGRKTKAELAEEKAEAALAEDEKPSKSESEVLKDEPPKKNARKTAAAKKEDKKLKESEEPIDEPPTKKTRNTTAANKKLKPEEAKDEPPTKKTRNTAAAKKVKSESEEAKEEPSTKKTTRKTAAPKNEKKPSKSEPEVAKNEPAKRKTKNTASAKNESKPSKSEPEASKPSSDWDSIDLSNERKNEDGEEYNLKVMSWNVAGLRAWLKKGGIEVFEYEQPDVICLQETKVNQADLPEEIQEVPGYHSYWADSEKSGFNGVAVFTKTEPIEVTYGIQEPEFDKEGRIITLEFEKFYFIGVYVPNAGRKLVTLEKRLKWNEIFKKYVDELNENKPVIIAGDMNVAHEAIDLANPKTNTKNAGFTPEEREGMTDLLNAGYVDAFRYLYPEQEKAYTFWTYMANARAKNVGWRLDYFILSEKLKRKICDTVMRSNVLGSDHCPLTLFIHI